MQPLPSGSEVILVGLAFGRLFLFRAVQSSEERSQHILAHRVYQKCIEACLLSAFAIGFSRPSCHRDQRPSAMSLLIAQPLPIS
jgi:hypothetical protein